MFARGETVVQFRVSGQHTNPVTNLAPTLTEVLAEHADGPLRRANQVEYHVDCRGLSSPVVPEKALNLPLAHSAVQLLDCSTVAVLLCECLRFDYRHTIFLLRHQ